MTEEKREEKEGRREERMEAERKHSEHLLCTVPVLGLYVKKRIVSQQPLRWALYFHSHWTLETLFTETS